MTAAGIQRAAHGLPGGDVAQYREALRARYDIACDRWQRGHYSSRAAYGAVVRARLALEEALTET
jgi:hypothetical protein